MDPHIRVERFETAAALLDAVEPALLEQEALNSLFLGILRAQRRQGQNRRRYRPLYAAVFRGESPEWVAAMTSPHKMLLAGSTAEAGGLEQLADHLIESEIWLPAVFGPLALTGPFANRWAQAAGARIEPGLKQQLYELDDVVYPHWLPSGSLRAATYHDSDLLVEWVHAFQVEALPSEAGDLDGARFVTERLIADDQLFVWQEKPDGRGRPLSMAAKARPLEAGISVNLVYTPPERRGRGYASGCVAALSHRLLEEGWQFVTLFTDRTNATSNHIYREIGYRPIADFDEYRFMRM